MNEHIIQVNIAIDGVQEVADFIVDLLEMVRDYHQRLEVAS